jgi:hypothetical protein
MPLFGKDATSYYSTTALDGSTNTADTVTWGEVTNIQDENDNFTAEEVDITTRATAKLGWSATATTIKNGEVTFTVLMERGDTLVKALMTAFLNATPITMMFLTGDKTSGTDNFGLAANWSVSMTFPKPVKGVQTADVTLKVYSYPEWVDTGT